VSNETERNVEDVGPGFMGSAASVGEGILGYTIGLVLAALLTAASFAVVYTNLIWGPAIPAALVTLAVAKMGVHLVFFLHLTTAPDNTNNAMALAFGVHYPDATRGLLLHWPVGGYRWKVNSRARFTRHYNFTKQNGLPAVVERARGGKSFWMDSEGGPWATEIARNNAFAASFASQDLERYLGIVLTSGRSLFDRDTAPGAEPEEVMGIKAPSLIIPGDDPSHATSGAHYLRELLPKADFWNVMPPEQTTHEVCDRVLEFCRAHR